MKITVTQEDIDQGKRGKCTRCPLAHAIKRAAGVSRVEVYCFDCKIEDSPFIALPEMAWKSAQDFDLHGEMEPFEFELAIP